MTEPGAGTAPHPTRSISLETAVALSLTVLLSLAAGEARAAEIGPRPRVLLIRPPSTPAPVTEALARVRGELTVEGFDAEVAEMELGPDVRASLERVAATLTAPTTAMVAVVPGAEPVSAELWVVDRMTGKTLVRHVRADLRANAPATARAAEVLSVRAVELLRASFLELAITSRPDAPAPPEAPPLPPPPPVVTRWATEPLEPDWTWAFEAGGGALDGASPFGNGVGTEFVPVARVQRAFGDRWCARATFAGLGTEARVETPGGQAEVSQSVGLGEALVRFRRGQGLEPIVSFGAGTLRLAAQGQLSAPYQSSGGTRWALAGDLGVGVRLPIRPRRIELGVELHAILAQPYPVVRFFEQEVARAGRPSLLLSVTLLGGL